MKTLSMFSLGNVGYAVHTRVLEDRRDGICVQRPHIKDNIFSGLGILFVHPHACRWT